MWAPLAGEGLGVVGHLGGPCFDFPFLTGLGSVFHCVLSIGFGLEPLEISVSKRDVRVYVFEDRLVTSAQASE